MVRLDYPGSRRWLSKIMCERSGCSDSSSSAVVEAKGNSAEGAVPRGAHRTATGNIEPQML